MGRDIAEPDLALSVSHVTDTRVRGSREGGSSLPTPIPSPVARTLSVRTAQYPVDEVEPSLGSDLYFCIPYGRSVKAETGGQWLSQSPSALSSM